MINQSFISRSINNSIEQIARKAAPEVTRWRHNCHILKVDYIQRKIKVAARGYSGPKNVKVQTGIQLGTPDKPLVTTSNIATIEMQPDGKWLCVAIRRKQFCATSTAGVEDVEVDTAFESSSSFQMDGFGGLVTPDDLFLPPLEALGELTLPDLRFTGTTTMLCGIPPCPDCAPDGYQTGMVLTLSASGCWVWAFRPAGQGGFYVQYENITLFRVTNVSLAGGTATQVFNDINVTNRWLAAPSEQEVIWFLQNGLTGLDSVKLGHSADGGTTFAIADALTSFTDFAYFLNYWQMWFSDLSDSQAVWGTGYSNTTDSDFMVFNTTDGGETSTSWLKRRFTVTSTTSWGGTFAAPRHNGTDAIILASRLRTTGATQVRMYLLPSTGGFTLKTFADNSFKEAGGSGYLERGCVRYGDTDHVYATGTNADGNVWKLTWSTGTYTHLGTLNGGQTLFRQILSTRAGTLLILDSQTASGSNYWLKVWRSTDEGVSWTEIDLTSLVPSSRDLPVSPPGPVDWWDFIALDKNDIMFIPLEDGTVLFCSDDGVTWNKSAVFLPTYAEIGKIQDNTGVGNGA